MRLILLVTAGLAAFSQAAASDDGPAPATSSPALAAALPELAATPGLVLVGYPVHGRSPRAIREAMNAARPGDSSGDRFDGLTTWRYASRWMRGPDGDCNPATAEITVQLTVTLPELTSRDQLSSGERADWDRYLLALANHEHNHVRIALAGAEQMQTFMRGAPDCATMQAARAHIGESVNAASRIYDANTRHGATEGLRYP